ncbi:hypothetical protein L484_006740 [Morus notabilis]|uniref:Uncharacterized protein n=1 Tax=Morus notabilis TaxID=981085 RepID=W9RK70_9ROSA|nr:hypothetical protein L484_006740 [Morus notabilis]
MEAFEKSENTHDPGTETTSLRAWPLRNEGRKSEAEVVVLLGLKLALSSRPSILGYSLGSRPNFP